MTNLLLILPEAQPLGPELALVAAALLLLLIARRVKKPEPAALVAVVAAAAALGASLWSRRPGAAFGGMLALDGYAHFFNVLFTLNLAMSALLSLRQVHADKVPPAEYYALLLLATTGMMLAASALELATLYLAIELLALSSCVLVGITRGRSSSNEAAIKYFLLSSFASAILLYGASLTYGVTQTTELAQIARVVAERGLGHSPLLLLGLALLCAGFAFKISAVPFHAWAPDVYEGACAPVAAFMAVGSKAAGFAALGRVCLVAFAPQQPVWSALLVSLAALSLVVGSLLAIAQSNVKRMLAYSSIAHAGYALLGLIAGTSDGISATMVYLCVYAFMTLGAFAVLIRLEERGEWLKGYEGLAATRPGTAALMLLFMLSLTGIPPTAGFTAKFAVLLSVVRAGYIPLAVLAVVCSVVSAFFYLRVAVLMYMKDAVGVDPAPCPPALVAALGVAAAATLLVGVFPGVLAPLTIPPGLP